MEEAYIAHEEELKEKRHRNWIKADYYCTKYLTEGLVKFVDEVVKKQHVQIIQEYRGRVCNRCTLQSLRPHHKLKLYEIPHCPLNQENCICLDTTNSNRSACRRNICGSIYNKILQLYFFSPPTPCWKNTDVKKWCEDPWAIAKCFISFAGYWSKSGPTEIDCTGLLHILINNKGLHRHLECSISLKGQDVFCRVRRTREAVIRSTKQELDDKELENYIDDIIEILEDKRELLHREESKKAVEKLLQLKHNDFVITPMKSIERRSDSKSDSDIRGSLAFTESGINTSTETRPAYSSKYESEFVHKRVLGSGAFGVVFEAENKVDKLAYAVKRITLRKGDTLQDKVGREVRALASLEHPNIVRYFHAWTELPPPGWQEQKDQQIGISESQKPWSSSNATTIVSSTSGVINMEAQSNAGSDAIDTELHGRGGNNDKTGLTGMLLNPFGQSPDSQESQYPPCESSDSWVSSVGSLGDESSGEEMTEESTTEQKTDGKLDDPKFKVIMPPLPSKRNPGTSQHDQLNSKKDQKNKQMQKSSDLQGLNQGTNKPKLFFYIQMQLCKPETLAQWLEENTLDTSREKQKMLDWFVQIIAAVGYVHDQGYLHRDLKPSNIFFSAKNVIKVGDFGFATALEEDQDLEIYSEAGTYLYMSPEVSNKCGKIKSNKVDIYSLGVILFELLYSFHTQIERVKTLEDIKSLRFPENFTREMPEKERLISKMLSQNPEERPTAKETLNEILFTEKPKRTRRETM